MNKLFFWLISFVIAAFAQPAWNPFLGYFAFTLGYALFFYSIYALEKRKRFIAAFFWFFCVQAIQLSWFTSTKYQGVLILFVYLFILCWFGLEFGIITLLLPKKNIRILNILAIASLWTIFEWSRLFLLCGFSFNQIGMCLANNYFSMQLASIIGIYGLSFYVILVSLTALKAVIDRSVKVGTCWAFLVIFPYVFGFISLKVHENDFNNTKTVNAVLVQTSILPEQKNLLATYENEFVSPIIQWQRIIRFIKNEAQENIDLIILPEAAVALGAFDNLYPIDLVEKLLISEFGRDILPNFPDMKEPYVKKYNDEFYASNSFFVKSLSNFYSSEIIIGLDDYEKKEDKSYNAAFYFNKDTDEILRYEKQVLVPIGEYIPMSWVQDFVEKKYNITGAFTHGKESKVFSNKIPMSVSICYEETYPYLMRQGRVKGANLFINITNDGWFYNSKLFKQHYDHAVLRSVENGVPLLRACNTGITAAVDSFGREIKAIKNEDEAKAIFVKMPVYHYPTLYAYWGDLFILSVSLICLFAAPFIVLIKKRKDK